VRPPIIVVEGLDVSFFPSPSAAAAALEGPDVIDGIYQAYDADGRRLVLKSAGGAADYSAVVVVEESGVIESDALSQLLREYLAAAGQHVPPRSSIAELVELGIATTGFRK
jgi:hypothetical protein